MLGSCLDLSWYRTVQKLGTKGYRKPGDVEELFDEKKIKSEERRCYIQALRAYNSLRRREAKRCHLQGRIQWGAEGMWRGTSNTGFVRQLCQRLIQARTSTNALRVYLHLRLSVARGLLRKLTISSSGYRSGALGGAHLVSLALL